MGRLWRDKRATIRDIIQARIRHKTLQVVCNVLYSMKLVDWVLGSNPTLSAKQRAPRQRGFLFGGVGGVDEPTGSTNRQDSRFGRRSEAEAPRSGEGPGRPESIPNPLHRNEPRCFVSHVSA